jgi:hypothetical protein
MELFGNRRRLALGAIFFVALVAGAWFYFMPHQKAKEKLDLPPNTFYYTGPRKGKGGQSSSDTFFPELGSDKVPQ